MMLTNNSGLCLVACCHRFIIRGPIIRIFSVFQVILGKVMQVLRSLWGLQGVKWHTFEFPMEGFWPL